MDFEDVERPHTCYDLNFPALSVRVIVIGPACHLTKNTAEQALRC